LRVGGVEALGEVHDPAPDRARILGGHRLDVHAALGREHDQRRAARAVSEDRGVELPGDVGALLHQHPFDPVAADRHAQDRRRRAPRLGAAVGGLDAARLAAPAGRHLRLDHDRTQLLGDRFRRRRRDGERRLRHGDADLPQEGLGRVLLEIHGRGVTFRASPSRRRRAPPPPACPPESW
jgi:hypothetical protein